MMGLPESLDDVAMLPPIGDGVPATLAFPASPLPRFPANMPQIVNIGVK